MREALRGVAEQRRAMPDGLVTLRISPDSGTLVSTENTEGIPEIFMMGHLPSVAETGNPARSRDGQADSEQIF